MKVGHSDYGVNEQIQIDHMFEKYHGFAHPDAGPGNRKEAAEVKYDDRKKTNIVLAYLQFLEGKACYEVFWTRAQDEENGGTLLYT